MTVDDERDAGRTVREWAGGAGGGVVTRRGALALGGAVLGGAALGETVLGRGGRVRAASRDAAAAAVAGTPHEYRVTVVNGTRGQPFTPPVVALHQSAVEVFSVGDPASESVRELAENGNRDPLLALADATPEIRAVATGDVPLVPRADPGGTGHAHYGTFTLAADPSATHLTVLCMLVATNDGFTGLDTVALPERVNESRTFTASAYDAGTERNTESFADLVPAARTLTGGSDAGDDGDGRAPLSTTVLCGEDVAKVTVRNDGDADGLLRDIDARGADVVDGAVPLPAGGSTTLETDPSGVAVLRLFDADGEPLGPAVEVALDCADGESDEGAETDGSDADVAEDGVVRPHPGVRGVGDLSPAVYGWDDPVAVVHVEKVSGGDVPVLVYEFDPARGELAENVAVDRDGYKYVSVTPLGQVWRFTPDDEPEPEPYASLPVNGDSLVGTVGVEVDPEGTLYVCFASDLADTADDEAGTPTPATNGVYRVEPGGEPELYAAVSSPDGPTFPNDILLQGDALLVTDSLRGKIRRAFPDGTTEVWAEGPLLEGTSPPGAFPLGTNGIARTRDGTVYTPNLERGTLVEVPVDEDGDAGAPAVFVEDDLLVGADGLAVDVRDDVYVAVNAQDAVRRVTPAGTVETLALGGALDAPADVTFGTTAGRRTTLYVVNLALADDFGLSDDPTPGLLTLDVGVPGLPVRR